MQRASSFKAENDEPNSEANHSPKMYKTFENEVACDKVEKNTPNFKDPLIALVKDEQFNNLFCQACAICTVLQ